MRRYGMLIWALLPIGAIAWHYGPGQEPLARDLSEHHRQRAVASADAGDWQGAAEAYAAAENALPEGDRPRELGLRLARAEATVYGGGLLEGQDQLETILDELTEEPGANDSSELLEGTRHALATSSYFATWLMRLEGATAEEWKPEAERARQQFRMLAEAADAEQTPEATERAEAFEKNLESTIRLEQMDLSELRARPLPKNCSGNCKNLSQRKRKQCASRCKGKGKGKKKEDARKQVKQSRGAGINEREGSGS